MARYYAPDLGRFISEDPARDGANWFVYCGDNPLRFVDPTGLRFDENETETVTPNGESLGTTSDNREGVSSPPTTPAPPQTNPDSTAPTPSSRPPQLSDAERLANEEKARQLRDTINSVIDPNGEYPQYQEGYPTVDQIATSYPAYPGLTDNTWCQAAANEILTQCGYDTSMLMNKGGIDYTNANGMALNAISASANPNSGVIKVTAEVAQGLADQGIGVLVIAFNLGGHGHAGVVAPSSKPYDPAQGPMIGQTGASAVTGIRSAQESFMDNRLQPMYFVLPRHK